MPTQRIHVVTLRMTTALLEALQKYAAKTDSNVSDVLRAMAKKQMVDAGLMHPDASTSRLPPPMVVNTVEDYFALSEDDKAAFRRDESRLYEYLIHGYDHQIKGRNRATFNHMEAKRIASQPIVEVIDGVELEFELTDYTDQ